MVLKGESSRKIRAYTDSTASPAHDDEISTLGQNLAWLGRQLPGAKRTFGKWVMSASGAIVPQAACPTVVFHIDTRFAKLELTKE
jgi:hypothetical protein